MPISPEVAEQFEAWLGGRSGLFQNTKPSAYPFGDPQKKKVLERYDKPNLPYLYMYKH